MDEREEDDELEEKQPFLFGLRRPYFAFGFQAKDALELHIQCGRMCGRRIFLKGSDQSSSRKLVLQFGTLYHSFHNRHDTLLLF
jgi:hypothetical protein